MLHCKLLRSPHPARAHRVDRRRAGESASRACTWSSPARTSRSRSASCRSRRTSTRSRPSACASSATRSRRSPRSTRRRRSRRCDLIDVEYEPLTPIVDPEEALQNARAAHPRLRRAGQRPQGRSFEFGDVDEALRRSRPGLRGRVLLRGQHAPADRAARRARARRRRRQAARSGPRRRRRTTCTARSRRCCSCRAAQIRVIASPNGGGFGGKCDPFNHEFVVGEGGADARPAGEDLPRRARRSSTPPRPPSGADEDPDRRDEGRQAHRRCTCRRCSTAAATARYGVGEHVLHRRAADGDLPGAALQVRGVPRVHQQAAVRPEARARHAAAALRPGSAARQDRREARPRSGGAAPAASSPSPTR